MSLLPVEPAWRLAERKEEHRWLIAGLWSEQAVGIIGGGWSAGLQEQLLVDVASLVLGSDRE